MQRKMDGITFPTTAAAAEPADPLCIHHHHCLPFPHFASSPPWFPPSPTSTGATAAVAVAPVVLSRNVNDMEDQEPTSDAERRAEREGEVVRGAGAGAADMEDQEPTSDAERRAEREGEVVCGAGAGAADEDKMDLLWENFNEELDALRRAGSCSKAAAGGCGAEAGDLELTSDTESEPAGRGQGCAPMLRASLRAGRTGQYRRTSWVLLMRIFRRFFVVEKAISAAGQQARAQ